jgi:hypothetical protein
MGTSRTTETYGASKFGDHAENKPVAKLYQQSEEPQEPAFAVLSAASRWSLTSFEARRAIMGAGSRG